MQAARLPASLMEHLAHAQWARFARAPSRSPIAATPRVTHVSPAALKSWWGCAATRCAKPHGEITRIRSAPVTRIVGQECYRVRLHESQSPPRVHHGRGSGNAD